MHFPAFWLEVISAIALSAHFVPWQACLFALMRSATKVTVLNKVTALNSLVFPSYLDCFPPACLASADFPQSPLQICDDVSLSMCALAIFFVFLVCLLVSSRTWQMSTAFCRSTVFSCRSSSCAVSITKNTILSHNILPFISSKLHKFARLWEMSWKVCGRSCSKIDASQWLHLISSYNTLQACLELFIYFCLWLSVQVGACCPLMFDLVSQ